LRSSRVDAYGPREQSILERLADHIAPAIENAELYAQRTKAEEALRVSEERHRELVETAQDVIYTVSPEGILTSLNSSFEVITGWVRSEWLGKPFASLIHPDDFPASMELFQEVLRGERPPIFERRILAKSGEYLTGEFLTTPQMHDGKVVGVFGIARDITERKRAEEALFEQTRETAVLEERNRMAREIHDTLAQGFTGIVLQLEAGEQALDESPGEVTGHLERAKSLARESLQEARRSVWNLLPHALEGLSLEEALQEEVNRYAGETQGKASFSLLGRPTALSSEVQTALLRVCQESLTNARKHAEATEVSVTLVFGPDSVGLDVKDNGKGFDAGMPHGATMQGGFGLPGMEQRANSLGGNLAVRSEKGKGTLVEVRMPR